LGSTRITPDPGNGNFPKTAEDALSGEVTASSTHDELGQQKISSEQTKLSYNTLARMQALYQTTGKAMALTYAEDHPGFRSSLAQDSLPSIYLSTPVWPLTDPSEAALLRHFVQNLAIWVGFPNTLVLYSYLRFS
jgi:hypothetical protein